ncbi:hypothetical protein [Deinococcus altitudinis]|uniref:hypothetical protein n=1 Tax=Deinococcus altitudinis TaxID=468914 RepID=UPI003892690C
MKRHQLIRICLMTSLRKRLWIVVLPAVVLGTVTFVLTFSLRISLPVTLLTALCATAAILWSSYQRHLRLGDFIEDHEFQTGSPFIFKD